MLQLTCAELVGSPYGLDAVLLLDTPTDDAGLTWVLTEWYKRSTRGGTCLIYLRQPDAARAWADWQCVPMELAADDGDAQWWELRRSLAHDRYDQVAEFTGETREQVVAKCQAGINRTKAIWEAADTDTAEQRTSFYSETDAYLYELVEYERIEPGPAPDPSQNLRQFELAHGSGGQMLRSAQLGPIWGFDLSRAMRDFLRFRVPRFYPHLADRITVLDEWESLPPASFDVVYAYHVLEHTEDPLAVLAKLAALLLPGGQIHIIAPFDAVGPEYPEHNPELAHLTVPGLLDEVGLTLGGTYPVGVWEAFVGFRSG